MHAVVQDNAFFFKKLQSFKNVKVVVISKQCILNIIFGVMEKRIVLYYRIIIISSFNFITDDFTPNPKFEFYAVCVNIILPCCLLDEQRWQTRV